MSEPKGSIMQRLKAETSDLHSHAESRTLQKKIATGEVDRAAFSAYLCQLYHVHESLESALDGSRDDHPTIGALATSDRMRVPDLDRDLVFHGVDRHDSPAGEAAQRFSKQIDTTNGADPVALLGALYVLEGSTNGGRFLARALRQSWGLEGDGLSYFDPYGEEQPQKWAAFKKQMDEASFDVAQEDAIVEMAKATFLAIAEVSDEVASQH
ncbi:MAG: biliverdin-producing heme oxygenase [Thermoanaerobaculales bacterium]|nr:biliverdin-producing heme oxygenase [Thermoanaerobaculales bacterium]